MGLGSRPCFFAGLAMVTLLHSGSLETMILEFPSSGAPPPPYLPRSFTYGHPFRCRLAFLESLPIS